jgi:hypothetical protein
VAASVGQTSRSAAAYLHGLSSSAARDDDVTVCRLISMARLVDVDRSTAVGVDHVRSGIVPPSSAGKPQPSGIDVYRALIAAHLCGAYRA